jgi:hypothetical protein
VTFTDTLTGATLCTETITATGQVPTCTAPFATAVAHPIQATYNGDANYVTESSPVSSQTVTVAQAPTALTLSALPVKASVATAPVTFTATVTTMFTGTAGLKGTVSFSSSDGTLQHTTSCQGVPVAAATGTANCQAAFPAAVPLTQSAQTITATYSSDPNFSGSTNDITQTVQNFGITNVPTATGNTTSPTGAVFVTQGYSNSTDPVAPSTVVLSVASSGGFADTLNVTCTVFNAAGGTVSDPSCNLSSLSMPGSNGSTLAYTLSASASAPIGLYSVTLAATDSTTTSLSQPAPALTVYVVGVANTLTLAQGASGAENAFFNTAYAPASTTLVKFSCGSVWDMSAKALVSATSLTCTGPATVAVTGATTTVSITVSTGGSTTAQLQRSSTIYAAAFLGIPILALLGWVGGRKSPRRNFFRFLSLIVLLVGVSYATGCGGSFSYKGTTGANGLAPGNYLVQVIATDANNNQYYAVVPLSVSSK